MPNTKPKGSHADTFHTDRWATYTNMKDLMEFSGIKGSGGAYEKYKEFTLREIEQHIILYVIQGLCPSLKLLRKMKPHSEEVIQGNDLIAQTFGKVGVLRHKEFRKYFCIQNPYVAIPDKKVVPNWKVDLIIKQMNVVSIKAVHLPEKNAMDEQTISFQGRSQFKGQNKNKRAGDGFQCDSICKSDFTYTIYFCHQPPPEKYTSIGLSPLHARVMFLFDHLKYPHHCIYMDNLYMSAMFVKRAIESKNKVKIHGVTRNHLKSIPLIVEQAEVANESAALTEKGTVKVVVLKGDPTCTDLVAILYYDSKPIYFLSTVLQNVKWNMLTKRVFNKGLHKMCNMLFLRPNFADDYNNDMDHVDITDHLGKTYQMGRCLLQRKWWWPMFMWAFDRILLNSYVLYKCWYLMHDLKPMTHYAFRESFCLSWLDSKQYWPLRTREEQEEQTQKLLEYLLLFPSLPVHSQMQHQNL